MGVTKKGKTVTEGASEGETEEKKAENKSNDLGKSKRKVLIAMRYLGYIKNLLQGWLRWWEASGFPPSSCSLMLWHPVQSSYLKPSPAVLLVGVE